MRSLQVLWEDTQRANQVFAQANVTGCAKFFPGWGGHSCQQFGEKMGCDLEGKGVQNGMEGEENVFSCVSHACSVWEVMFLNA